MTISMTLTWAYRSFACVNISNFCVWGSEWSLCVCALLFFLLVRRCFFQHIINAPAMLVCVAIWRANWTHFPGGIENIFAGLSQQLEMDFFFGLMYIVSCLTNFICLATKLKTFPNDKQIGMTTNKKNRDENKFFWTRHGWSRKECACARLLYWKRYITMLWVCH